MNTVYALQKINTWWRTNDVEPSFLHKRVRSEFMEILKSMDDRRVTGIIGPSGTGKTSLLYNTIDNLLKLRIPPKRILYISGGEMTLFGDHRSIGGIFETYATDILHENLFSFREPVYIFIDDIEFIEDWQVYLTNYVEKTVNIKFFISRTYDPENNLDVKYEIKVPVMPLTLPQFSEFYFAYKLPDLDLIKYKSLLPEKPFFEDPAAYYGELSENIYALRDFKPYKSQIANEYLLCGGYPAYFSSNGLIDWQKKLMGLIDIAMYRDVGAFYNIKSTHKLKRLLYIIAEHGATEQSFGKLGHSLYVDTSTIIGYVQSLSQGGFAGVAENYSPDSGTEGHVVRKNRRLYIYDTGVANAVRRETSIAEHFNSHMTNACLYLAKSHAGSNGSVYFWKNGSHQVDIVVCSGKSVIPVSVCCQNENLGKSIKSIKSFTRGYQVQNAVIITRDLIKRDGRILFIPYWLL